MATVCLLPLGASSYGAGPVQLHEDRAVSFLGRGTPISGRQIGPIDKQCAQRPRLVVIESKLNHYREMGW